MTPKGSRPVLRGLVGSNAHPATQLIDFLAVLFGYAISGERTLEGFYQRLLPWANTFMALFGRDRLPARSTLSRFLASLDQAVVEALRTLFLRDLLVRPLVKEEQADGLWDRRGNRFLVFDIDGTREAARQRALPQTADRPVPQRRLADLCAPGYTGRKRGEVVRTRTTVLQAHTHQWLATFGNAGNGQYRTELRRAVAAIQWYCKAHEFPEGRGLLRLDGQYGTGAVLADLAGFSYVTRGKDYQILDQVEVQALCWLLGPSVLEKRYITRKQQGALKTNWPNLSACHAGLYWLLGASVRKSCCLHYPYVPFSPFPL
jgi:hypothetical protein